MGIADIVPGVSGGTIAIITGVYEELLKTINGLDFEIFKELKKGRIKSVWNSYNLSFLLLYLHSHVSEECHLLYLGQI